MIIECVEYLIFAILEINLYHLAHLCLFVLLSFGRSIHPNDFHTFFHGYIAEPG